jgi:hypothetical protein
MIAQASSIETGSWKSNQGNSIYPLFINNNGKVVHSHIIDTFLSGARISTKGFFFFGSPDGYQPGYNAHHNFFRCLGTDSSPMGPCTRPTSDGV